LDAAVDGEEVANFHVEGAVPYILAAKAMTLAPNFTPTPFASATDGHLDLMLFRVCICVRLSQPRPVH
jgi:hypothetical protein